MSRFKFALMISLIFAGGLVMSLYQSQAQPDVVWGKQWGTIEEEFPIDMRLDEQGNIYMVGVTKGSLFGQNQGERDVFVVKLDSTGQVLWSKQLGTAGIEETAESAVDGGGNVYIAIITGGDWFGKNMGERDVVLVKLSTDGQLVWGKRLGTSGDEFVLSMTLDNQGYIYIAGVTRGSLFARYQRGERGEEEGFLVKLDSAGNLVWGKAI